VRKFGGKPSKYRAKKTVVDGITFDSRAEAARYQDLLILERAGEIQDLRLQVKYVLTANGQELKIKSAGVPKGRVVRFIADFVYVEKGKIIIEDVKGMPTPVYKLKKAIMESMGYEIREHRRSR